MTTLHVSHRAGTGRPIVFLHGLASSGVRDWPESAWRPAVDGRPSIVIDLPAHGGSAAAGVLPTSRLLDELASAIIGAGGAGEVDVVGYSLGARLAWDLAGHPSLQVRRLVLGGLAADEPFAFVDVDAARSALRGGDAPSDPLTGMIVHMAGVPGNDAQGILDLIEGLAAEPFRPADRAPVQPVLLLGGEADEMAAGIDDLARLLPQGSASRVPGDHLGALHSPALREAVRAFLVD